jgi:CheY-like chemotaxis protein
MRPRVLIADDETHALSVLSASLSNAGFDVVMAANGSVAHDLAIRERPDVLVVDYQMPGLSGIELCTRLRAAGDAGRAPAILMAAPGFHLGACVLEPANIRHVLRKPVRPQQLLACLCPMFAVSAARPNCTVGRPSVGAVGRA